MRYETVIGLEVHAQLLTESKMFCPCSSDYASAPPNTHVCPVCMGMPGVLPVINERAVEYTVMTGLALNCSIPEYSKFDRKNYPYPDLMKGYQISQYDAPLAVDGWLNIPANGQTKRVNIIRVHLEEDTAKLVHHATGHGEPHSLVDANRAGVPLMEIVSHPDMRSPEEARQYLMKLRTILQYLGVSTGNMEEGSFRCDANISIRPEGATELTAKVEVKNMNSFKAVFRAMEYEEKRQRKVVESGERLPQETRGWQDEKGITVSQRSKEYAHDYRYFPEPDLPPMSSARDTVEKLRARLPELPDARAQRFAGEYGLSTYDAGMLSGSKAMADYFEKCVEVYSEPDRSGLQQKAKAVANWLIGDFSRLLNLENMDITASKITPAHLVEMLRLIEKGVLGGPATKAVFEDMFKTGKRAVDIVTDKGLQQIGDADQIKDIVRQVISANAQAVADYRAGKAQAIVFLTGQVMRASRGRANPQMVKEYLEAELGAK